MKHDQAVIILARVFPRMDSHCWEVFERQATGAKLHLKGTKQGDTRTKQEDIYLANNLTACVPYQRSKYIEQYIHLDRSWGCMLQIFKRLIVDACPASNKAIFARFPSNNDITGRWFDIECQGSRFRIYDGAHNTYTYQESFDHV